ncbi:hypothetical protein EII23_06425 [Desulfovibrio sp. OH1186_COT-070]|nr:hypothetical protein EII24_06425 [Desulfovibrio sp. OH1209_COT-279]RRD86953.1 hypothetical protein EII23_06425 [Desulfovibrio sp. OH1186_COT-070]
MGRSLGIEMIAPNRKKRAKTQDGRPLRRYRRRWKVERRFAWLQNFRRLVVRYEFHAENFLAMAQLAPDANPLKVPLSQPGKNSTTRCRFSGRNWQGIFWERQAAARTQTIF